MKKVYQIGISTMTTWEDPINISVVVYFILCIDPFLEDAIGCPFPFVITRSFLDPTALPEQEYAR